MARIDSTNPTLSNVKKDLANRVVAYLERTEKYLGEKYCQKYSVNLCRDNFDIHEIDIGRDISVYYEYAFEARMPRNCDIENWSWSNPDGFKMLEEFFSGSASGATYDMIQLVNARRTLDNGKSLSIKQIALLAGMTEKSVRNAFHANGGNRLEGVSAGEAGELDIGNHEAKCWLKGRRSFRETTFEKSDDQQPERLSHAGIRQYIRDRVSLLYSDEHGEDYVARAAKQIGWENGEQRLFDIMLDTSAIQPTDCESLANLIKVDAAWFTEQVMRALFPRQMDLSLKSALSKHQSDEGNNGETAS